MTRTAIIATLSDPTAQLTPLRAALKAADAYNGVSRLNRADLRAHAQTVAAAMVKADEADAAKAQAEADAKAAEAAKAAEQDAPPSCPITGRKLSTKQLANDATLAKLMADNTRPDGSVVVDRDTWFVTCGAINTNCAFSISGWRTGGPDQMPSRSNPYFMAALRMGVQVVWVGDKRNTGELHITALGADDAQAQRAAFVAGVEQYTAALAERRAAKAAKAKAEGPKVGKVDAKAAKGLAVAIAATAEQDDGSVVLDAVALVTNGVAASWAKAPASHFTNADHTKARTLHALGWTGKAAKGCLVLTPLAKAEAKAAS
jgi:hypothetical protein